MISSQNENELKGIICQVVPWEQRKDMIGLHWFESKDGGAFDLLVIHPILSEHTHIRSRGFWSGLRDRLLPPILGGPDIGSRIANVEDWRFVQQDISVWVARPNEFKKGQTVNLDLIVRGYP